MTKIGIEATMPRTFKLLEPEKKSTYERWEPSEARKRVEIALITLGVVFCCLSFGYFFAALIFVFGFALASPMIGGIVALALLIYKDPDWQDVKNFSVSFFSSTTVIMF